MVGPVLVQRRRRASGSSTHDTFVAAASAALPVDQAREAT
jgi:hypothetical protein